MKGYVAAGALRQGAQHVKHGVPCQDAVAFRSEGPGGAAAVVVCDGLGSKPMSHFGSTAVARGVLDALFANEALIQQAPKAGSDKKMVALRLALQTAVLTSLSSVVRANPELKLSFRDLACTLNFGFWTRDGVLLIGQQGDSPVVLVKKDGTSRVVNPPQGEWGATRTVVDHDFATRLLLGVGNARDVLGTVHMTDGAEDSLIRYKDQAPAAANRMLVEEAGKSPGGILPVLHDACEQLVKRTHDDVTVAVLAIRQ